MAYTPQTWVNGSSGGTPVNATRLNYIESGIKSVSDDVDALSDRSADYVVAQGTSGNWTYRKWNSGIAECWHNNTTITGTNENYSWNSFDQVQFSATFPFTFASTPSCISMARYASNWAFNFLESISTSNVIVNMAQSSANTNITIHFLYAIGRWK